MDKSTPLNAAPHPLQMCSRWKPTLNGRELGKYDLGAALLNSARHQMKIGEVDCFERDVSETLRKSYRAQGSDSLLIPFEALAVYATGANAVSMLANRHGIPANGILPEHYATRTMKATDYASGGALVGGDVLAIEDLWRPVAAAVRLGAQIEVVSLKENVQRPTVSSDFSLEWLAEGAEANASDVVIGARPIAPLRLSGGCSVSKQLLYQSRELGTRTLSTLLLAAGGIAIDRGLLGGAGGAEPAGVLTAHDHQITFGAAATHAKLVDMEGELLDDDVPSDELGFAVSTTALRKWRTKSVEAGSGRFLAERVGGRYEAIGHRLEATTLLGASNRAILGRFPSIVVYDLQGPYLGVSSDPFSRATNFEIEIWLDKLVSVDIRTQAFCASTDSAAQ